MARSEVSAPITCPTGITDPGAAEATESPEGRVTVPSRMCRTGGARMETPLRPSSRPRCHCTPEAGTSVHPAELSEMNTGLRDDPLQPHPPSSLPGLGFVLVPRKGEQDGFDVRYPWTSGPFPGRWGTRVTSQPWGLAQKVGTGGARSSPLVQAPHLLPASHPSLAGAWPPSSLQGETCPVPTVTGSGCCWRFQRVCKGMRVHGCPSINAGPVAVSSQQASGVGGDQGDPCRPEDSP